MPCQYKIEQSKDEEVYETGKFQLECKIHSDQDYCTNQWKKCTWTRNKDNMKCHIHHLSDDKVTTSCDGQMKKEERIEVDSSNMKDGVCRIKVNSSNFDDTGMWICSINPCMNTMNEKPCKKGTGKEEEAMIEVKVNDIFLITYGIS